VDAMLCGSGGPHLGASPGPLSDAFFQLPEACANLCFGGAKRNRLFMTASQSLYALYVNTQGAQAP
jgi:gluconolactonase